MCQDVQQIFQHKNSDTAVFLGSGSSINRITKQQWSVIGALDSWAVNNWLYHPEFVPDFYHVEAKHYNYEILRRRFQEKKEAYAETRFIFARGKTIKMPGGKRRPLRDIVFEGAKRYEYDMRARDPKRMHPAFNANYERHPNILTKSYDMSLTVIFELLYKTGYRTVVTFGIDLKDSYYFWTDRAECGEVHHQTNKAHEGKPPTDPHATHRILEFIVDFNARWMCPHGREIFVGHTDTLLYPYLRFKSL